MKKKIHLPAEVLASFNTSLSAINQHHYTIDRLSKDLKNFESELSRQLETNSRIIESGVRELIAAAREILQVCRREGSSEFVPYCLAAVDYLVNSDDAVPDFADYDGFDDDRAVLEEVIRAFALEVKVGKRAA